jgi:hypothetical protein
VLNKTTSKSEVYTVLADYPIEPFSVGTPSADVLVDAESRNDPQQFWATHDGD